MGVGHEHQQLVLGAARQRAHEALARGVEPLLDLLLVVLEREPRDAEVGLKGR